MENILQASVVPNSSACHNLIRHHDCEEDLQVVGGYFDDGRFCWIANDSLLTVLRHSSRTVVASKKFSTCLPDDVLWTIVSCKALDNILLVGLASTDGKGAICLFNHNVCKIIKTIFVPYAVNCMEVILEEGGATISSKPFASNLRWFFGVVAVGTLGGHLYLIDLRLDDNSFFKPATAACIEVVPTVIRDIPEVRDAVCTRGAHLAFDLLEQCHENEDFHFVTPDDQIVRSYHSSDTAVSSLFFEKRCVSLFVGFSFGQFLIYDLKELALRFSSQIQDSDGSVNDFVFQEPENDPKHFCYLWVVQCTLDEALIESVLKGTMFQLIFEKKELLKENNCLRSLYIGLDSCNSRFQVGFDDSLGLGPSVGTSKILQCRAIERYHPLARLSGDDEYASTPYSSILSAVWVTTKDEQQTVSMLLFDINGWYVAHMPSSCRGFSDDETFVALWSLNSCISENDGDVLALCTSSTSLRHFHTKIHPTPRQFTQPSSVSLQASCLTTKKFVTCKMSGVQEQAIEHLLTAGCECLLNPSAIFDRLLLVGLMEHCGGDVMTVDQKREAILTSALNHDIFAFLCCVISGLATGEYVASGCTLRLILEWAWKQTAIIKNSIDNLCVPIFDCSAVTLDDTSQELLSRHITQLSNLHLVFKKLRQAASISQLSELELDVKGNVIELIQGYLKILRWFIGARLLPEQLDDHISFELETYEEFHFVYKQRELRKVFEERRSEIKKLNTSSETSLLIIDGLIEEAGSELLNQWKDVEGKDSVIYPPPSLYALLSMYYLEGLDTSLKHSITTYFLLDILAVAEASNEAMRRSPIFEASFNEHRNIVSFFPLTFRLSLALTKLIQAFWLLDHRQYQESCLAFCEPGTERVTSPWQHRRILQAYMQQGHSECALQYLVAQKANTSSIDDVKLHIDVLVTNSKLHHALRTAQMKADSRNKELIYSHLFAACYKHGELHNLLKLTITNAEELMVSKYLEKSGIPRAHDILVLHHLRRARYVEAIQLYKKNKKPPIMAKHDELEKGYHATLSHLIQGYMLCLPDPIRDVASLTDHPTQRNTTLRKEVPSIQPLSAVLNSSKKSAPLSQAELLSLTMGKVREVAPPSPMTPFRRRPDTPVDMDESFESDLSKRFFSTDIRTSISKSTKRSLTRSRLARSSLGGADDSMLSRQMSPLVMAKEVVDKKRSALMKSASTLLQTPPIERNRKPSAGVNLELMTPQSILKVKMLKSSLSSETLRSASTRLLSASSHSTSMTSLREERVSGKLEFRDDGLDSSGSECETPAWMLSSMTSQIKEKTPAKNYLPCFNIQTPEVPQISRLRSKNTDSETESLSERPSSSTKRLRFRDLINSESSEEILPERTVIHLPPLNNVVVEETDEKDEVDVIGNDDDVNTSISQPSKRQKLDDELHAVETTHNDPSTAESISNVTLKISAEEVEETQTDDVTVADREIVQESVAGATTADASQIPDSSSTRRTEMISTEAEQSEAIAANEAISPLADTENKSLPPLIHSEHGGAREPELAEMSEPAFSEAGSLRLRFSCSSDNFTDAESHISEEKMSLDGEVLEISSDEEIVSSVPASIAPLSVLIPSQRATVSAGDEIALQNLFSKNNETCLTFDEQVVADDVTAKATAPQTTTSISSSLSELENPSRRILMQDTAMDEREPQAVPCVLLPLRETHMSEVFTNVSVPAEFDAEAKADNASESLEHEPVAVETPLQDPPLSEKQETVEADARKDDEESELLSVEETVKQILNSSIEAVENKQNEKEISRIVLASSPTPSSSIIHLPPSTSAAPSASSSALPMTSSASPLLSSTTSVPSQPPSTSFAASMLPSNSSFTSLPHHDVTAIHNVLHPVHFDTDIRKSSHDVETPLREPVFILSPPATRSRTKSTRSKTTMKKTEATNLSVKKTRFEESPPKFVFSPPSTVRTRSRRKRKLEVADDDTEAKAPRTRSPPKTPVASASYRTPTRSSKRLTEKKGLVEKSLERRSTKKSPEIAKTATKSSRSVKDATKSPDLAKNVPKLSDVPKTITKTKATRTSRKEVVKSLPRSSKVVKSAAKISEVAKTGSKSPKMSKAAAKSSENVQTPVAVKTPKSKVLIEQSIRKSGRTTKSKTAEDIKNSEPEIPVVTRTTSRSRNHTVSASSNKKDVAPSPSARADLPSPTTISVVARNSSWRTRSASRSTSEEEKESAVALKAPVARRTRSSSVPSDDVITSKTPSHRKRSKDATNVQPLTVTSTSSRGKRVTAPGNEQLSVATTRSRSKSKNQPTVTELDDIIEENERLISESKYYKGKKQSIFKKSDKDFSKDPRCPVNHSIRLIPVSPDVRQSAADKERPVESRRVTRSGKALFPVMSRRKAKIFVWDKKERAYKKN